MSEDIRWKQRFDNYRRALQTLRCGVELAATRELSELETQGLIQEFEFTHELAWNVLKDYLEEGGFRHHRLERSHAGGVQERPDRKRRCLDDNDSGQEPLFAYL